MHRFAFVVLLVAVSAACAKNPTGPSVPAGREFQLQAGASVVVSDADLGMRFERVLNDGRCPADVWCVHMGDAVVALSVTRGGRPAESVSLHTQPGPGQRTRLGDWVLTLSRLDPYPLMNQPIAPSDYRVTLRVDRATLP